ncbi:aspartate/glutamate racemase family protein [Brevibacillus fluminis]|uniref:aspartate/glutamate racemase family protein n=1 Tax=Brevibacillus fluminis TaxID=511487 RepID=UPI003F8B9A19
MGKTIGIMGGMGPMATIDLFEKIVAHTPAATDQDHIRMLIYNNPKIPSRMEAILEQKEDPLPEMIRSARLLEAAGVDFILIPCHTAHAWYEPLQDAVTIPIVHMIENTVAWIERHHPQLADRILLLATTATLQKRLYQHAFSAKGMRLHIPSQAEQQVIAAAIAEAKASRIQTNPHIGALNRLFAHHQEQGVAAVLGACTEIPLLFPYLDEQMKKLDPTLFLAKRAISLAQE